MNNLVSIIVPVFNRETVISETILSVKKQTFDDWELILVDDGSTDNTLKILHSIAKKDERIKIYQRNRLPKGAPTCRNIGLTAAKGSYIIFLDSDDILAPFCLKYRVDSFKTHFCNDFLVFNGAFFNKSICDATIFWNKFDVRKDLDRFLHGEPVWQTSAPIWKKDFLKQGNFLYNETAISSQDWEFHTRILLNEPNYNKMDSLPDYFIRRSSGYQRISDDHKSFHKILNRATLIRHILHHSKIFNHDKKYREFLLTTLLKEYHTLLLMDKRFETQTLLSIYKEFRIFNLKKILILFYILLSNQLLKANYWAYKIFLKICNIIFLKKAFYHKSFYRSKMSDVEIKTLISHIKQYESSC